MIIIPNMKSIIGKKTNIVNTQKIIVGGNFVSFNGTTQSRITRLNSNGGRDTGFTTGVGFGRAVRCFAIQSDGKIFVGGEFTSYNGITQYHLVRLNSDGSFDTGFTTGTGFNFASIYAIAIQPDGKILVGGTFTNYNETTQNRITRLNSNGTRDTGFTIGTGFNSDVRAIAIQSDGKILIGGFFSDYNGATVNYITRLNSDGTLDTGFTIGTGFDSGPVNAIAIQSDGKIVVGGAFTSYNGTTQNFITRLNSDGTLDAGFTTGTGFNNNVLAVAVQLDGKIVAGGAFTIYNEATPQNRITRLNSDGTLDTGFTTGTGFNLSALTVAVQLDGKIVSGGIFSSFNGTAQNRITRLNSNGILDTSFAIGTGFNSTVNSVILT